MVTAVPRESPLLVGRLAVNSFRTCDVEASSLQSRRPVFFPQFFARGREMSVIMTKIGAKRQNFWVLPSQKLLNDLIWKEISRNGEEISEIWKSVPKKGTFSHIPGKFFGGARSCFTFPICQKAVLSPPRGADLAGTLTSEWWVGWVCIEFFYITYAIRGKY